MTLKYLFYLGQSWIPHPHMNIFSPLLRMRGLASATMLELKWNVLAVLTWKPREIKSEWEWDVRKEYFLQVSIVIGVLRINTSRNTNQPQTVCLTPTTFLFLPLSMWVPMATLHCSREII